MPTLLNSTLGTIRMIGVETTVHSVLYRFRKAWAAAGWQPAGQPRRGLERLHAFRRELDKPPGHAWPDAWTTPGAVRAIAPTARGATLTTERASIEIVFFAPDLVRVRVKPHTHAAIPEPLPYAIAKPLETWPAPAIELIQAAAACFLRTDALTVGVALDTAQVIIADAAGRLLRADVDAAWGPGGEWRHRAALAPDERLFGLGERATPGNRRGRTHVLWNTDPAGYVPGDDPINLNIPVYVSVQAADQRISESASQSSVLSPQSSVLSPQSSVLVFYENPYYAEFDLGAAVPDIADHRFAGGELRYYVAAGPLPALLERYTELTGRHDLPPLWMLGYQQCRWSYYPESRVRKLAQDFKDHEVPCDAIYLDIDYLDDFRCFTWDKQRFPDLPQLVADLRAQGIKTITMIDPGIKKDPHYAVYRSGLAGGHFCQTPDGRVFHAPVWPGLSAFPDFTDPAARAWWGPLYAPLLDIGIAGFWNDMNEPATFAQPQTTTLPDAIRHSLEGRGGDHAEAHNLYGMQMVRATREGLLALRPETRPVVITRAGWAGVQRHATSWTGDNQSTWESLRLTIPEVIGLGLSGLGFTGPDVGGFAGAADGELFTRWMQMAAFLPLCRAHTSKDTPDQEPWSYGEPYLSIARRFIQLRYELLPYLYTAVWQMCRRGWPLVRPLGWMAPASAALWDVEDAFLCGDALLVAPIGEPGATNRKVTLPPGGWYDFWTNKLYATDSVQSVDAYAPLETLPLFVRAGTVLPLGEFAPSVEQRRQKFLRLNVYPLPAPGETVNELYEDAGEGFTYRGGDYCHSRFHLTQTVERLTVVWERAGSFAPPYEHLELTLHGLRRAPRQVLADGVAYPVVMADPVRHTALLGIPPFEKLEVVL